MFLIVSTEWRESDSLYLARIRSRSQMIRIITLLLSGLLDIFSNTKGIRIFLMITKKDFSCLIGSKCNFFGYSTRSWWPSPGDDWQCWQIVVVSVKTEGAPPLIMTRPAVRGGSSVMTTLETRTQHTSTSSHFYLEELSNIFSLERLSSLRRYSSLIGVSCALQI